MTIEQKAEVWLTDFNKGGGWRKAPDFKNYNDTLNLFTCCEVYDLEKAAWLAGHAAAVEEYKELNGWIPVTERQPEIGRKVPFICMSRDEFYNGQQMWGTYQGFKFREHEFTTPGIGWSGSHWLDLDFPPSPEKEQQ